MNKYFRIASFLTLLVSFIAILSVSDANADTWGNPRTLTVFSPDSTHFVILVPTHIPDRYSRWISQQRGLFRKPFTEKDTIITPAHAMLYKRVNGADSLIWNKKLLNRFAPTQALITNNGQYLITFDDWYQLGYGVNVVVVYNEYGDFVRRFMLEEISPFPINN